MSQRISATRPKLILIDGHSLAYRAFFASARTQTFSVKHPDGSDELTGAVYFFTNMLLKVWKQEQPDYIAVAFDVGKTFRDELFPAYKGTRAKMPDELISQMKRIQQVVTALGVPIFTAENYEADDVLGTLSMRGSAEGMDVILVTGDRDALQLVQPHITVLTSGRSFDDTIVYDEAEVLARYGIRTDQMIDYKALIGDTSDNVPGVKGIGEKTAQALLQQYGSLDAIYDHLDEVMPKRAKTALEENKDIAYLSRDLVTIRTNVPIEVEWESCKAEVDYRRTLNLFRELEFSSLIRRIPVAQREAEAAQGDTERTESGGQLGLFAGSDLQPVSAKTTLTSAQTPVPVPGNVPTHTRLVDSDESYKELLEGLNQADRIAFDTETTSPDPLRSELVGVSLTYREGEAWYVPCDTRPHSDGVYHIDPTSIKMEPLARALRRSDTQLMAHNAKFDLEVLQGVGITVDKPVFDTMVAQFLCDPGSPSLGLKQLAFSYLGWQMTHIDELIGKGRNQITMRDVPVERVAPYASADADATWRLAALLEPILRQRNQERLFHEVELPLIHVLIDMEMTGVALDVKYLASLSIEITEKMHGLERDIYNSAGTVFNINSTQQLSDVLFGRLQLPTQGLRKTAGGAFSTAADVLETLQDKHAIIPLILQHRELSKLKGTYVDALPALINPNTGRLHTDYNQAGAVTGRLSSSNPNLQNIPIKSEIGRRVRKAFIPRKGWRLISADYSQVELRILAHLADDTTLKAAFARGEDIHATTAAAIYDTPLKEVSAMQRSFAKRINFGIAYGMGAFALAQSTGMSQTEALDFIRKYFERFPRVRAWLDETKQKAVQVGYVETVLGRRRYFPELQGSDTRMNDQSRRRAEREAINHPVQGSAADIMKIAMIKTYRAMQQGGYQAKLMLQVHDELVLECPTNEVEVISGLVKDEMENAYPLSVKLRADVAIGKNWDEVE
ncbi:MAG: DNA polymerase I [Chloroflexi bacterium]|nr:DNA polymerase I [Chloroflexota bacterium]MCL5275928.1 DNA polymerase I [Chloroflexota bacterium]